MSRYKFINPFDKTVITRQYPKIILDNDTGRKSFLVNIKDCDLHDDVDEYVSPFKLFASPPGE